MLTHAADWRVTVRAEGLETLADPGLELPRWGWADAAQCPVQGLVAHPEARPVAGQPGRWRVMRPAAWDGALEITYRVRVNRAGAAPAPASLLPFGDPDHAVGFARNVLVGITHGERRVDASRRLWIAPPHGWTVATGYGMPGRNAQNIRIPSYSDNAVLAAGLPRGMAGRRTAALFSVIQLGGGPDISAPLLHATARLWEAYATATRFRPEQEVRLLVTPAARDGVHTGSGILIPLDDLEPGGRGPGANVLRRVAHEVFHLWLGESLAIADPSLDWFKEGVTEYAALRALVATGIARPQWFAQRLGSLHAELAKNPEAARLAFDPPPASWRASAEREALMYGKGPLLALGMDVALRRAGHRGLLALVGELARDGRPLETERLRTELRSRGLGDFVVRRLQRPRTPDPAVEVRLLDPRDL